MSIIELLQQTFPRLMAGLGLTLEMTLISLLIAAVLGLLFGLMTVSKNIAIRGIARVYINIIRGTPIIVQAFFIYFGVTAALGIRMESMTASIITLSLNAGAYTAEIVRAGIQSVPNGQMEAARSLGLPYTMAMRKVILPQAIRTMIPTIINQCIITLKDSSILSVIGVMELTNTGKQIIAQNLQSFQMWLIVGVIYLIIIMILTKISSTIEKRLNNY